MKGLVVLSVVVVAVVTACGWQLGIWRESPIDVGLVAFCAAVNLVACWLSFLLIVVVRRTNPDYLMQAALAGIVVRMMIAGSAAMIALSFGPWPSWPLSIWMIVFYLALLIVETMSAIKAQKLPPTERSETVVR